MRHRGFSLIELIVTLGIVAILIAFAIPALGVARERAHFVKSLSNLRQIGTTFDLYQNDWRDTHPFPIEGQMYPIGGSDQMQMGFSHWAMFGSWNWVMHDYVPWHDWQETLHSPGTPQEGRWGPDAGREQQFRSSYLYSASFIGRPGLWSGEPVTDPDRLVAPTRGSEVRFAAEKAMLWDSELSFVRREFDRNDGLLAERIPILFADRHAEGKRPNRATDPVVNAANTAASPRKFSDTKDGVFGRDF